MARNYEITEADIDRMIEYIRTIDPDNATPEMAIRMLENEYAKYHTLSHQKPEVLEAIYHDLNDEKKPNIKTD